mgnify:CR=1 FL=1
MEKAATKEGLTIKGTVTITKIDMKTRIVTLTGSEGRKYKVKAGKSIRRRSRTCNRCSPIGRDGAIC